jgi:hypothetical protein
MHQNVFTKLVGVIILTTPNHMPTKFILILDIDDLHKSIIFLNGVIILHNFRILHCTILVLHNYCFEIIRMRDVKVV